MDTIMDERRWTTMKLYKRDGKLRITMPEEAVYANIKEQHGKICSWLKEDVEEIIIKIQPLKIIDSAWFSLLLALKYLSKRKGINFSVEGESEVLHNISRLYNIYIDNSDAYCGVKRG